MARPLGLAQPRIVEALAQAEGGEHHGPGLERGQQTVERQAGERQGIDAAARHARHLLQRLGALHRDQPGHGARLFGGDLVVMDDVQRIARLLHVQAGEGTPRAAHGVEGLAGFLAQPAHALDGIEHGLPGIALARRHQPERPDRQRAGGAEPALPQRHQLEAAAAQVAHHARGIGHAADHAEAREARLVLAAHDMGLDAGPPRELAHEVLAVGGVAHGGGRQQVERRHLHVVGERGEAVDVGQRHLDAFRIEAAGGVEAAGQAAQHLFVEHRQRRPACPLVDDETDRVRADVDDADAALADGSARTGRSEAGASAVVSPSMRAPSSRNRAGLHRRFQRDQAPRTTPGRPLPAPGDQRQERSTSRGTAPLSFSALPRPDSDGLVMK